MDQRCHERIRILGVFCGLVAFGVWCEAHAQYSLPSQASQQSEKLVMVSPQPQQEEPRLSTRWELGASFNFITSDTSLGGEELDFTDIVFLRLHGLVAVGKSAEVFLGTDILPKQPSYTDELAWQGGLVGVRAKHGNRLSTWARASGGPQLLQEGYWVRGDAAVSYRLPLEKTLFFESSLGWAHTQLLFKGDVERNFYVDEAFTELGLALREPRGHFGAWLSFDYFYPILSSPDPSDPDPVSGGALDPQPRVNFHMGALVGVSESLSLFIEWSILDRGDLEAARTTLPFLNTGFDQKQLLFGFVRRFGNKPLPPRPSQQQQPPPVDIAK